MLVAAAQGVKVMGFLEVLMTKNNFWEHTDSYIPPTYIDG